MIDPDILREHASMLRAMADELEMVANVSSPVREHDMPLPPDSRPEIHVAPSTFTQARQGGYVANSLTHVEYRASFSLDRATLLRHAARDLERNLTVGIEHPNGKFYVFKPGDDLGTLPSWEQTFEG